MKGSGGEGRTVAICIVVGGPVWGISRPGEGGSGVTGEKDVVFGDPTEVQMPPTLRSHGSTHELRIPMIGYNGDFSGFSFDENRDMGSYIFERVLA